MRYPVLALLVLGVLGIGVAVDWNSPSRAPVPAIKLQAAPPQASAASAPRLTLKKAYGGRELNRIPLPVVRRPAAGAQVQVQVQEPPPSVVGSSVTEPTAARQQEQASTDGPATDTDERDDDAKPDASRPRAPQPRAVPAAPTASGTGADPAPAAPPASAGDSSDDEEEDDDDDDDGGDDDDDGGDDDDDGDDD